MNNTHFVFVCLVGAILAFATGVGTMPTILLGMRASENVLNALSTDAIAAERPK